MTDKKSVLLRCLRVDNTESSITLLVDAKLRDGAVAVAHKGNLFLFQNQWQFSFQSFFVTLENIFSKTISI